MNPHSFVEGNGTGCALLIENPGQATQFCRRPITHPCHVGVCFHCKYALHAEAGDGDEVCRFCQPHYSQAPKATRCGPCAGGTSHT